MEEYLRNIVTYLIMYVFVRSYCDECGSAVWPLLQTIYECRICSHIVHAQCLNRFDNNLLDKNSS